MRDFIKDKLETIYADICIAASKSNGLCELKKFTFSGGNSPNYGDPLVRMYYMLKYFPGYLAEYYLMYKKLLKFNILPEDDIDIISIGCGCGVDYWGFHFIAKGWLEKHRKTTSYTGYDIHNWEYRDKIDNVNVEFTNKDIGTLNSLDSGKFAYNVIVFPKSISDLPADVYENLVAAIETTKFERDKIAILCSLMLDGLSMNYDFSRLNRIVDVMTKSHGYICEDNLNKYTTMVNPEAGLNNVVSGFNYSLDINSTINSILHQCPNFQKNGKSCKDDCTTMNQWPVLKQKYVNYAIRRLRKES